MLLFLVSAIIAVIINSISQILIKKGAIVKSNHGLLQSFLNFYSISGYSLMLLSAFLGFYANRGIPFSYWIFLLPFNFLLIGFLSFLFLNERMSKNQYIASSLIVAGVLVFNF